MPAGAGGAQPLGLLSGFPGGLGWLLDGKMSSFAQGRQVLSWSASRDWWGAERPGSQGLLLTQGLQHSWRTPPAERRRAGSVWRHGRDSAGVGRAHGANIFTCEGHVKAVLSLDWSPSGHLLATGSEDNTARVWDLRKRQVLAILPGEQGWAGVGKAGGGGTRDCANAFDSVRKMSSLPTGLPPPWPLPLPAGHTSLVSAVRFEPNEGGYLLTGGYDNTSRVWGGPRFRLLRTLAGHEGKVMGADVSPDGTFTVATSGYDRTIKLWAPDPLLLDTGEGEGE